jgi:hypothetical protein
MAKACSTVNQSKKLIKLGIDKDTSDMYYELKPLEGYNSTPRIGRYRSRYNQFPAWSISALVKLVPPYLGKFSDGIDFSIGKSMNGKWYTAQYLQCTATKPVKVVTGKTVFDAVFDMVCWLKENGKI